jgi:hypothetical protein
MFYMHLSNLYFTSTVLHDTDVNYANVPFLVRKVLYGPCRLLFCVHHSVIFSQPKTTRWSFFIYISKKLIVWQNNTNEHIRHYSIIVSTVGEQHLFSWKIIYSQTGTTGYFSAKRSKTIYCISSNSPLRISPSYECIINK